MEKAPFDGQGKQGPALRYTGATAWLCHG